MASVQAKGVLRFYKVGFDDSPVLIHTVNVQAIGAGGSPDGAITNSPEKWLYIPYFGSYPLSQNDRLRITFEAEANVTIDASDGAFIVPITLQNGTISYLKHPTNSAEWDVLYATDKAFVANSETPFVEMRVKRAFVLGSNKEKSFVSIEDNTA